MNFQATQGNVVIEVTQEALKSSGGTIILAGTIQKLIVRSIGAESAPLSIENKSGNVSGISVGNEVEIQPHLFRKLKLADSREFLLGSISGILAVITE